MKAGAVNLADLQVPQDDGAVARSLTELETKLSAWTTAMSRAQSFFATKWTEFAELERRSLEYAEDLRRREERLAATAEMAETAAAVQRTAAAAVEAVAPEARAADVAEIEAEAPYDEVESAEQPQPDNEPHAPDLSDSRERERAIETLSRAMHNEQPNEEVAENSVATPELEEASGGVDPDSPEGVEAILATLEPETANAIRIRYQAAKGQKPIRTLIEEYQDEMEEAESLLLSLDPERAKAVRVRFRLFNGRKTIQELVAEIEAESANPSNDKKKSWWKR